MKKGIQTLLSRRITVRNEGNRDSYLIVEDTSLGLKGISSILSQDETVELANMLLEAAGKTSVAFDELPEVTEKPRPWYDGYLTANNISQRLEDDPKMVLEKAKGLFAIALELQKRQDAAVEKAKAEFEAEKVKEAELTLRRDELVQDIADDSNRNYIGASTIFKAAIDRIIELEDDAKSQP